MKMSERAQVGLAEVVAGMFTLVALIALTPFLLRFAGMASTAADPFSSLLLQITVPLLFIAFLIGIGGAATGG